MAVAVAYAGALHPGANDYDVLSDIRKSLKKGVGMMLTAFTNVGTGIISNRVIQAGTAAKNISWGTGTTVSAVTQTDLVAESTETLSAARVVGTESRVTTTNTNDTYQVAGTVTATALGTPVQSAPSTATTGGSLAANTYYYKVSALGASGETLPSNEQSQATTGTTSTVTITWAAINGATGYRIYRGTAAGSENVYYSVGAVTTFTDTGGASTGGSPLSTATATKGITEAGLFDAQSVGTTVPNAQGNMLIRGDFAAVNVAAADSIAFTFKLKFVSNAA